MADKLNAFLASKAAIMAISIIAAVLLWYNGYMSYNPIETKTYDLPLRLKNVEYLPEHGKFLLNEAELTAQIITVTLRTTRRGHNELAAEQDRGNYFYAYIDFSTAHILQSDGAVSERASIAIPERFYDNNHALERIRIQNETLYISLDSIITAPYSVRPRLAGAISDDDNFTNTQPVCEPREILVTGPRTELSRIRTIDAIAPVPRVDVTLAGSPNSYSERVPPQAFDIDGSRLFSENIHFNIDLITVSYSVQKIMEIPIIQPQLTGEPYAGFALHPFEPIIDFEPKGIEVKGNKEDIDELSKVGLRIDPVDISWMVYGNSTFTESLRKYLTAINDRLEFVNPDNSAITVSVRVERIIEETFDYDAAYLEIPEEFASDRVSAGELAEPVVIRAIESFMNDFKDKPYQIIRAEISFDDLARLFVNGIPRPRIYGIPVTFHVPPYYEIISAPGIMPLVVAAEEVVEMQDEE
jgi:YbbR domain-containing protein